MPKLPRAANANLAEAHVPRERQAGPKMRTGVPDAGAEEAGPASALCPPAAAAAPRPPLLSLKGVGKIAATRRISRSTLPTAPIKTQRHSPGKRALGRGVIRPGL